MKTEETQQAAQALFEAGHITYWRTDSTNLKPESIKAIRVFAGEKGLPLPKERAYSKQRKALRKRMRPLGRQILMCRMQAAPWAKRALYKLIWLRAVASQLADAVNVVSSACRCLRN